MGEGGEINPKPLILVLGHLFLIRATTKLLTQLKCDISQGQQRRKQAQQAQFKEEDAMREDDKHTSAIAAFLNLPPPLKEWKPLVTAKGKQFLQGPSSVNCAPSPGGRPREQ